MDIEEEYDKIFRYCYWKVHNKEIAEDMTQETFLRFLQRNYNESGKKIRFLYTIARNLCIDESRKKSFEDYSLDSSENKGTTEDFITQIYVKQILSQLSEEDRDLMMLDLFTTIPSEFRILSQIRSFTPLQVLINSSIMDPRLIRVGQRYLTVFQSAPIIYGVIAIVLCLITISISRKYIFPG